MASLPSHVEIADDGEYYRAFRTAEAFEYSRKDFSRAAQLYRESAAYARTDRERAIALGARGRCLMAADNPAEARRVYEDLRLSYGRLRDQAGHFFALTAALQLHEIDRSLKSEAAGMQVLFGVYQSLRDGAWPLSRPEYEFMTSEIESLIEADLRAIEAPEIDKAYRALRNRPSPYLDALLLAEFLRSHVVPRIKE